MATEAQKDRMNERSGTGRQLCVSPGCGRKSLPGLLKGHGMCAYHFTAGVWGKAWANHVAELR